MPEGRLDHRFQRAPGLEDELVLEVLGKLAGSSHQLRDANALPAEAAQRDREDGGSDEEMEDRVLVVVERHPALLDHGIEALPSRFLRFQVAVDGQRP